MKSPARRAAEVCRQRRPVQHAAAAAALIDLRRVFMMLRWVNCSRERQRLSAVFPSDGRSTFRTHLLFPGLRRFVHVVRGGGTRAELAHVKKGKGGPYSIAERRVPELIPVFGSQPAGDVSHKPGGRPPSLSARPAVTIATLNRAATNFAAW